jgi:hypothetical protein
MKKFSKLITEKKVEIAVNKHPLMNDVDWEEIFKPLIEHIEDNLEANAPSQSQGLFSTKTKSKLEDFIDSVTEDYVEYYQNVIDDGSQESFFNAYKIECSYSDIMNCLAPLLDRTSEIDDYPTWDGGYYYIDFFKLKYTTTDELIEDILDIWGKLKMYPINYEIRLYSYNKQGYIVKSHSVIQNEEKIVSGIKNLLELPSQKPSQWVNGLNNVQIYIYNKDTVQAVDLD